MTAVAGRAGLPAVRLAGLLVAAAIAGGCARVGAPPGGTPDHTPPVVDSTTPGQLAVVPGFKGPVQIRFDERISEKGIDQNAVAVSPDTGGWQLDRKSRALDVKLPGGWRRGVIYRVVVNPVVQDLFGNRIKNPFELVFSTGPQIPNTVLGGVVTDRLTGKPSADARVEAMHLADSLTYVAAADKEGVFVMRHVPTGRYMVRAYVDQNRSRTLNVFEPRDSTATSLAAGDTTLLALALLPYDSTPAQLVSAGSADSLHVRITFDDYFGVDQREPRAEARIWQLPDSTAVQTVTVFGQGIYRAQQAKAAPAPDTTRLARDTTARAARDTTARDTGRVAVRPLTQPGAARAGASKTPLPSRDLYVELRRPLAAKTKYRVTVSGITNITGLTGGGGTVTFETPAARDTSRAKAKVDTAGAKRDTIPAAADTTHARVDTTHARVDTTHARVDTTHARVDTTHARVDTTGARADTGAARVDTSGAGAPPGRVEADAAWARLLRRLGLRPGR